MNSKSTDWSSLYQLRRVTYIAAAATVAVNLAFLLEQSAVGISPLQEPQPIDQMMYYLEFFGFATASYFMSAAITWKSRCRLQTFVVPWVPICVIGSVLCSTIFAIYIYIENQWFPKSSASFLKPVSFIFTSWAIVVWSVLFIFISSPISALTSAIYTSRTNENDKSIHFNGSNQVEKTAYKS
jgi:hypothetical protein